MDHEETAAFCQLKGVSPLHLKPLISAAVRGTSGITQCQLPSWKANTSCLIQEGRSQQLPAV